MLVLFWSPWSALYEVHVRSSRQPPADERAANAVASLLAEDLSMPARWRRNKEGMEPSCLSNACVLTFSLLNIQYLSRCKYKSCS